MFTIHLHLPIKYKGCKSDVDENVAGGQDLWRPRRDSGQFSSSSSLRWRSQINYMGFPTENLQYHVKSLKPTYQVSAWVSNFWLSAVAVARSTIPSQRAMCQLREWIRAVSSNKSHDLERPGSCELGHLKYILTLLSPGVKYSVRAESVRSRIG